MSLLRYTRSGCLLSWRFWLSSEYRWRLLRAPQLRLNRNMSLDCLLGKYLLLLWLRWQRGIGLLGLHTRVRLSHLLEGLRHELHGCTWLVLSESGLLI